MAAILPRYGWIVMAAGLLACAGPTHTPLPNPPSIELDDLPLCFSVEIGAWSSPPPFDFPFAPTALTIDNVAFVEALSGDTVGWTAILTDGDGRSTPWAWIYSEDGDRIELFRPLGGTGDYELHVYRDRTDSFGGEAIWWVDRGSRGYAAATLEPAGCSHMDEVELSLDRSAS